MFLFVSFYSYFVNVKVYNIVVLLKFVLETTYFRLQDIYQQTFGVALSSPVCPTAVNLYMEDLKRKIIATATDDCKLWNWMWYVDDIICLVHTYTSDELQQHMNTVNPTGSGRFRREEEANTHMPFLGAKNQTERWQCELHTIQREDPNWSVS